MFPYYIILLTYAKNILILSVFIISKTDTAIALLMSIQVQLLKIWFLDSFWKVTYSMIKKIIIKKKKLCTFAAFLICKSYPVIKSRSQVCLNKHKTNTNLRQRRSKRKYNFSGRWLLIWKGQQTSKLIIYSYILIAIEFTFTTLVSNMVVTSFHSCRWGKISTSCVGHEGYFSTAQLTF